MVVRKRREDGFYTRRASCSVDSIALALKLTNHVMIVLKTRFTSMTCSGMLLGRRPGWYMATNAERERERASHQSTSCSVIPVADAERHGGQISGDKTVTAVATSITTSRFANCFSQDYKTNMASEKKVAENMLWGGRFTRE